VLGVHIPSFEDNFTVLERDQASENAATNNHSSFTRVFIASLPGAAMPGLSDTAAPPQRVPTRKDCHGGGRTVLQDPEQPSNAQHVRVQAL
jgi:hypothetical protein